MAAHRFNKSLPKGGLFALLLAITVGRILYSPCIRRLVRNATLAGIPDPVKPAYPSCTDTELVESVSLVVTVKDTCAQAGELLEHLASLFPRNMHVLYAYPNVRGCRNVAAGDAGRRLFQNFTELVVGEADAPIAGFLKAQPLISTKYAVLMHNDAYPMERDFACEMFRALEAHPHYPIAAPQIYEVAEDGIIVPHGHHQHLHVRPSSTSPGDRIDYDLSMKLLTMRKPEDFEEGPQVDFLEDHAFFARVDRYHELLDPSGSFTLEYMDMILNMRARNTSAWYVPTARCIFNVDTRKITWEDLPYLVYKRSEQIGHQVRTYLTKKWGVEFVNTGIWNYVRYVMLADVVIEQESLPTAWEDQAASFYSWFESVGFNRYDGQLLPQFIERPSPDPVHVSRTMKQSLPTDVPAHRVPPQSAPDVLPRVERKKLGIDISFKEPHLSVAIKKSTCNATDSESYSLCGLAVQDGESCTCYNYVVPFNLRTTLYLDKLMAFLKLPARAFMYGQMKYWTVTLDKDSVDFYCAPTQEECGLDVHFPPTAKVLQWSWFGKQPKHAFTPEGIAIGSGLALFAVAALVFTFGDPKATLSQELRKFWALNKAICTQAMRS